MIKKVIPDEPEISQSTEIQAEAMVPTVRTWDKVSKYAWVVSLIFSLGALGFSTYNFKLLSSQKTLTSGIPGTISGDTVSPVQMLDKLSGSEPILGDKNAPLTIVEFADFQCPFCKRIFDTTLPSLKQEYIDTGKAKLIFVNVAFLGQESKDAGEAAKCAQDQGQFWAYHDALYTNQQAENTGGFSAKNLQSLAKKINLNMQDFDQCVSTHKYQKVVEDETALSHNYNVVATPTMIIQNQVIRGSQPLAVFQQTIENFLKK